MTTTDTSQVLTPTINTEKNSTTFVDKSKVETETPLMRYFDLAEDSSDCYVLGYN